MPSMAPTTTTTSASASVEQPSNSFNFARSIQSVTAGLLSHLPKPPPTPVTPPPPSSAAVTVPFVLPFPSFYQNHRQGGASPSSALRNLSTGVRIDGISSSSNNGSGGSAGGPAFVGQVFSMLDPSGNGLMAVTTHFDIPFLSKRTPQWVKKMFATAMKSEQNGPVFRFFMDLGDAVAYVKRLNVPTGMVGACRLDVAYQHFKEKPHMFQFVPNKKQVIAANKLLKETPLKGGKRKLSGVPVFSAQNLNIAIATNDGIRWYIPYFFDKSLLDNILEASVDQHFHTLIQSRHMQRRRDVVDDNLTAEMLEESGDSLFEPPEVQEAFDELDSSDIPLSVISKAAETKLLDVVDKVLLGNKWLRKATGIQPKFPYMVDSFEERSAAASLPRAVVSTCSAGDKEGADTEKTELRGGSSDLKSTQAGLLANHHEFQFPFGDWFSNPWSKLRGNQHNEVKSDARISGLDEEGAKQGPRNPLLPKITMVGISMGEGGAVSRASLKKTMEDLTKDLERNQNSTRPDEDKDPLFVANVGDYSAVTRMNTA